MEFLQSHGYCSHGTPISMLQLSLLLHQATNTLPRAAVSKLAVDTFSAIAYVAEKLAVDLLAERVSAAVVAHLEDPVEIIHQAVEPPTRRAGR